MKQAVDGFAGDVIVKIGAAGAALSAQQRAGQCVAAGLFAEVLVLLGDADRSGLLFHDRQERVVHFLFAGPAEEIGGGGVAAADQPDRVLQRHLPHRIGEDVRCRRHRFFRRAVHRQLERIDFLAGAELACEIGKLAYFFGHQNLHRLIAKKSIGLAQLPHRAIHALRQRFLDAARGVAFVEIRIADVVAGVVAASAEQSIFELLFDRLGARRSGGCDGGGSDSDTSSEYKGGTTHGTAPEVGCRQHTLRPTYHVRSPREDI